MATQPAILSNPFIAPMKRSYITASAISIHTAGVLFAQRNTPSIGPLNTYYAPINTALANAFAAWIAAEGIQKGKTLSVKNLLADLSSTQIKDWDFAIQQAHRQGTSRYVELLPNGRNPFQEGRQDQRIAEVDALIDRIGTEPALQTLKADIQTFYDAISGAESIQEGAKGGTETGATLLQTAIVNAATGLYAVYGGLIQVYPTEPARIGDYYNMELILNKEQRDFTGTVPAATNKNIAKRTLPPTAQIRIVNNGNVELRFYFAAEKNDAPPATGGLLLAPSEDQTVAASTLGTAGPFLNVANADAAGAGKYAVVIL